MQRGEVRWYPFAEPDKRRPVLILTRDSIIDRLGEVTVAPITTRVRGIPTEVPLTPEDGLPHHCAINCDHLMTVPKARLGGLVATLPPAKVDQVRFSVLFALGFRLDPP